MSLIEHCPNCERLRWREQEREDYWQTRLREAKDEEIQARIETELQLRGAIDENEMLRLQVSALENDGMELAAKLGEAEQQIARLTTRRGQ